MMRQNLFTIAPDTPFLDTLAARVLDGTLLAGWPRSGPFWLVDVTILVPTRRARLALADAFARRGAGLLPDIRTLGGEDSDEAPFLPPVAAAPLPPAVSVLERRLVLARLIASWAGSADGFASPPNAAEILWLADSLAGLVDDLEIEGVAAARLAGIAPENLAANWQETLRFLDIALTAWPLQLAARQKLDAAALRTRRLARQAETAAQLFGERPVIAAGSTGSIPATAALLQAIGRLPRGTIVLPGLDTGMLGSDLAILTDPEEAAHAHPQYGLVKLLGRFEVRPDAVTELGVSPPAARTLLLRRALATAPSTADWVADRKTLALVLDDALEGMAILAAPGEDLEARAVAVAAREALASRRSVGIVTPDRNLARRIAAELSRFDIEVDDGAGTPLFQSAAGRLARLLLALAAGRFAPVDLMAVLRNRAAKLGLPRPELQRLTDRLDLVLRGERPGPGLAGLRRTLQESGRPRRPLPADEGAALAGLLDRLGVAVAPLCALFEASRITSAPLAAALREAIARIAEPVPGETPIPLVGAAEFAAWADELAAGSEAGPVFPPAGLDAVLAALMAGTEVRNVRPRRQDIAIWGQLEARLQRPDLMILAGLNEDVWPGAADSGPWLSRGMRLAAGLKPPERRQGQAAHDFEMAAGNPEVILAYATRRGSSPALPSPLLQRLEAFVGDAAEGLRARGASWLATARAIDAAAETRAARRPAPNPPAALRPRQLSVTAIETLFRSPYDIYARHVLNLRPLDAVGEEPGARERGSMIHQVFDRFVQEGHDPAAPGMRARLDAMAAEAFSGLDAIGERRDIWLKRFSRAAELFLAFERDREANVAERHAEVVGAWRFPLLDNFLLTGRADRVDLLHDGGLEIIDFKTGGVPRPMDMKNFEAPQLLLEAAMAAAGMLEGISPAPATALTYIKIGLGPEAFVTHAFAVREDLDLAGAAEEASIRMQKHVSEFLLTARPMVARLRPAVTRYRGAFEHLARTDEWLVAEGDDEP